MQSNRLQEDGVAENHKKNLLRYEKPQIIYRGKITIRAGSPIGGRIGPPGGPDILPGA